MPPDTEVAVHAVSVARPELTLNATLDTAVVEELNDALADSLSVELVSLAPAPGVAQDAVSVGAAVDVATGAGTGDALASPCGSDGEGLASAPDDAAALRKGVARLPAAGAGTMVDPHPARATTTAKAAIRRTTTTIKDLRDWATATRGGGWG